jgi:hypothetical protein
MEVVGRQRAREARLLGGAREVEELARGELLVRAVIADADGKRVGHGTGERRTPDV